MKQQRMLDYGTFKTPDYSVPNVGKATCEASYFGRVLLSALGPYYDFDEVKDEMRLIKERQ